MRKSTTKWQNKKYGKRKTFLCKRINGMFCFHLMIWDTELIDPKAVDFYESIQVARREGWHKA